MSDNPFSDPNTPIDPEARLKRLTFRAWRRGFKEADLIMGRFADTKLYSLSAEEVDEFERLLDAPDTEAALGEVALRRGGAAEDGSKAVPCVRPAERARRDVRMHACE